MNINTAIAIAGIWIGVGACAFGSPETVPLVAMAATLATIVLS